MENNRFLERQLKGAESHKKNEKKPYGIIHVIPESKQRGVVKPGSEKK